MVFNFKHYMKHSNQLNEFTLGQLKGIVKDYPYFQLARILYLKNLYLLQNADFEDELKKAVVYIYNRPFLHDLLFEQNISNDAPTTESSSEDLKKKDDISNEDPSVTEEPEPETVEAIEEEVEEIVVQAEEEILVEEEKEAEEQLSTKKNFSDSIKENISDVLNDQLEVANREKDNLEISQVHIDIEKEYGKDLEKISKKQDDFILLEDDNNINKTEESEETNDDSKRISNSVSYAKDLLEFDYVLRNTVKYNLDNEEPEEENKSGKSFSEWLDSLNNAEVTENTKPENTEPVNEENNNVSPEIKNQIIDSFIQNNPAIKPEDKPFEFEDISTESVKEDDNLVTDTLARIYYNQGRYDKALEAYEKLSLKYPEKNSYFASQIEKIKNKLNDLK